MHRLLKRQLRRHLPDGASLDEFGALFEAISQAYDDFDADRRLLERTMDLSSKELMKANAEMHAVLQSFPDLFMWVDERDRITHIEAGDHADLCQVRSSLIGCRLQSIPDRSIGAEIGAALDYVRSTREPRTVEYSTLTLDGEQKHFEARLVWLVEGSMLAIIRNVTDQKLYESSLLEAKRAAERAAKAKSEFLANMSHEIRTPLTAILGFSSVLDESDAVGDPEATDLIRTIHRNAEHLLMVINDVLDLSQIEAGKMRVERIPVDLEQLTSDVFGMLEIKAREKELEFELVSDLAELGFTRTDPGRLKQILINLIGNAIKFTPKGSVKFRVRGNVDAECIEFDVVDTGIGIAKEHLDSVFQSFSQADASHARRFGGTGLGLTISRRLVELLGGTLSVQSVEGEGSTFSLRLPFVACAPETSVSCAETLPVGEDLELKGVRILLAEDGPDNQRLLTHVLKKAGAAVTLAKDGIEAVEAHKQQSFDVILMDMQMPRLDGYGATRQIRRFDPEVGIIALTAHALEGDREKCLEAGCSDFQMKPIRRPELLAACARGAARRESA